jgi:hypothetical protein
MQTSYVHDQTKRAYKDFVGQFDALTDDAVVSLKIHCLSLMILYILHNFFCSST